jgi:hypothetical protein
LSALKAALSTAFNIENSKSSLPGVVWHSASPPETERFQIDKGRYRAVGGSLGLRWDDYSGKLIHELDWENLSLFGFTTIYKRAEVA